MGRRNKNRKAAQVPADPVPAEPAQKDLTPPKLFVQHVQGLDLVAALRLAPAAYAHWWLNLVAEDPWHVVVETVLLLFIAYLVFAKRSRGGKGGKQRMGGLSEREVDDLVAEWEPEPLVPATTQAEMERIDGTLEITSYVGNKVVVKGVSGQLLNLSSFDFLGMSDRQELKQAAHETLEEYGCGSCGPRGFYGSVMPHVEIEDQVAEFMGTEGAISYSDDASTVSSSVAAFAKKGDVIVVDEGIHEALQVGVELSRAKIHTYAHNDMGALTRVLEGILADDKKLGRDKTKQRRFIVSEALFRNTGTIADVKKLVELKQSFGFRLVLDESFSFGCLGDCGRGVAEMQGIPVTDVDIMMVSMTSSLASVGGLCIGSIEVVDHQRLSGAGYCFSASAPPFVSRAASAALKLLREDKGIVGKLQEAVVQLNDVVKSIDTLQNLSDPRSPILHVALSASLRQRLSVEEQDGLLFEVSQACTENGVLACVATRMKNEKSRLTRKHVLPNFPPTLRLTARADLATGDLRKAGEALKQAAASVLARVK